MMVEMVFVGGCPSGEVVVLHGSYLACEEVHQDEGQESPRRQGWPPRRRCLVEPRKLSP